MMRSKTQLNADDAIENIDVAFSEMTNDPEYQAKALQLEGEVAVAQWEA